MNKQLLTGAVAVGTLAIGSLLQAAPAEALGLACAVNYENNVDATGMLVNLGCQRGLDGNDNVGGNNLDVNLHELFGHKDWLFAGKDPDSINISNEFPGNVISGTYNLNQLVQSTWTDVMLVFKGGEGNPIRPQEYVGYLLAKDNLGGWTGTWKTPFFNINNDNQTGVSHISLYYREGTTPIPTPALLPGLLGMSVAALRKKK